MGKGPDTIFFHGKSAARKIFLQHDFFTALKKKPPSAYIPYNRKLLNAPWCDASYMHVVFVKFGFTRQKTQIFETQKMRQLKKNRPYGATNDFIFISNHKYREDEKQRKKGKKKQLKKTA